MASFRAVLSLASSSGVEGQSRSDAHARESVAIVSTGRLIWRAAARAILRHSDKEMWMSDAAAVADPVARSAAAIWSRRPSAFREMLIGSLTRPTVVARSSGG